MVLFIPLALAIAADQAMGEDAVLAWNRAATEVMIADAAYQNPGMASRTLAMVNIAMYDAINGIAPEYEPFYSHAAGPAGASLDAAVISSAYQVLSGIYGGDPAIQADLDARRTAALSAVADGPDKTAGVSYGSLVGGNVVAHRRDDGFDVTNPYTPSSDAPGVWEPDPLFPDQEAWGPDWGGMRPFAIDDVSGFAPPAPPGLGSAAHAAAFNEVKRLGAADSATRTAEQTRIGKFWAYDSAGRGTPMVLYNDIARSVAEDQGNSLTENAYLFAKTFAGVADAGIVAWDSKFDFELWRPVTGIRRADEDGNPETIVDPDWTPLGAPGDDVSTPPFPTYLSGHATFGGALFKMLELHYGTDAISFSATSAELSGPEATRTFSSFSEAMAENGRSRVYLGIHWSYDDVQGQLAGIEVAEYIADRSGHFRPIPEPTSAALVLLTVAACLPRRGGRLSGAGRI